MTDYTNHIDERTALFSDLDKPSLEALSYALRHPDTWPKGFVWYYGKCEQCAVGLAHQLWKDTVPSITSGRVAATEMARAFAIPYDVSRRIFVFADYEHPTTRMFGLLKRRRAYADVTPEMVADDIDAYLASMRSP